MWKTLPAASENQKQTQVQQSHSEKPKGKPRRKNFNLLLKRRRHYFEVHVIVKHTQKQEEQFLSFMYKVKCTTEKNTLRLSSEQSMAEPTRHNRKTLHTPSNRPHGVETLRVSPETSNAKPSRKHFKLHLTRNKIHFWLEESHAPK